MRYKIIKKELIFKKKKISSKMIISKEETNKIQVNDTIVSYSLKLLETSAGTYYYHVILKQDCEGPIDIGDNDSLNTMLKSIKIKDLI